MKEIDDIRGKNKYSMIDENSTDVILLFKKWNLLFLKKILLIQIKVNELFLSACENGDYITVSDLLNAIKDFNIDITNDLGKTALRLAIENEHLEVKELK